MRHLTKYKSQLAFAKDYNRGFYGRLFYIYKVIIL